jgi:tetratricopeptide (TPR) repeat protein
MRALEEGQAAGGDSRGVQSAAILVVREGGGYGGFSDRYCDLRVDDHEDPIGELRRIFDMWKHDALIMEGYRHSDEGEWERAFEAGRRAIAMSPEDGEPHYHLACYYAKASMLEEALEELERAYELDGALPVWAREDPDLEALREEGRFQALLGED